MPEIHHILLPHASELQARGLGSELAFQSPYPARTDHQSLFLDRFGRPGKGNDKGKVEGLVGYARRNFLVPIPTASKLR